MIIENVRLGKKQVLKIIQNGQIVWEYDNRFSLGSGVIETFTFDNVSLDMLALRILQANSGVSNAVSTEQAKLGTIIMWPMKATADISESTTNVAWQATPAEPLSISFMSGYVGDVELIDAFAEKLYTLFSSKSNIDADLLASAGGVLSSDIIVRTLEDTDLVGSRSSILDFKADISTDYELELERPLSEQLSVEMVSRVDKQVILLRSYAGKAGFEIDVKTTLESELKSDAANKLDSSSTLKTKHETKLHRTVQGNLEHAKNVLTKILSTLDCLQGNERLKYVDAFIRTLSAEYGQLTSSKTLNVGEQAVYANSTTEAMLRTIEKLLISGSTELLSSDSVGSVELPTGITLGEFDETVQSDYQAVIVSRRSVTLSDANVMANASHDGSLQTCITTIITEISELLDTKQYSSVEICRLADLVEFAELLKTSYAAAATKVRTTNSAEFEDLLSSSNSGSVEISTPLRIVGSGVSRSTSNGRLTTSTLRVVGSTESALHSKCYAALTFDGIDDDWLDPIQIGSNLYIRQTYEDPLPEGTNLDISEVYFEPVQEGGNLHIISLASIESTGGE